MLTRCKKVTRTNIRNASILNHSINSRKSYNTKRLQRLQSQPPRVTVRDTEEETETDRERYITDDRPAQSVALYYCVGYVPSLS